MKFIKRLIIVIFLLGLAGILLIKFDTGAAAIIADNYLRPLIGNDNVIYLERIFFNISDRLTSLTFNQNKLVSPEFSDQSNAPLPGQTRLDLTPLSVNRTFKSLKGEGVWKNKGLKQFPGEAVMAYTFVRPDPDRPYAIVTLLQIDTKTMNLGIVAGKKQPGGPVGNPGPGVVPAEIINSNKLVAAFDGGFQYRDGMYGMIVGDKTYLPLQSDIGTLVGYKDGRLKIVSYTGQDLGKDIAFIRQNCPILIEDGRISILDEKNKHLWGRTPSASIFTWRSGLGLTKEGNLVYAVGNNLSPLSLSYALKAAGADNAIQLDINPFWVRFNFFTPQGNGLYLSSTLTKDLFNGGAKYLSGYDKDFFYLYLR